MELLRKLGFRTAAMALRDDSVSIDNPGLKAEEKLAVILGTEGDGTCRGNPSRTAIILCGSHVPRGRFP